MLSTPNGARASPAASRPQSLAIGWIAFSEIISMTFKYVAGLLCAAAVSIFVAGPAAAQQTVKIGAIYPLSGNAASAGVHGKAAIETAVEIINNAHPELGNLPLAKNAGLAGLGGAKVEVVFADNQGSPAAGQNQEIGRASCRER